MDRHMGVNLPPELCAISVFQLECVWGLRGTRKPLVQQDWSTLQLPALSPLPAGPVGVCCAHRPVASIWLTELPTALPPSPPWGQASQKTQPQQRPPEATAKSHGDIKERTEAWGPCTG